MNGNHEAALSDLMRRALSGDEPAYREFLGLLSGFVRTLVGRKIRSGGSIDVEDIVQEVLLAVHTRRHTWRASEPITPWIAAIARYKVVDAYRRRGIAATVDIADFEAVLPAETNEVMHGRDVDAAMLALGPGQRKVVTSIAVKGRSVRQTAADLGMTEGAVRVCLHRGLAAIRNRMSVSA